MVVQFKNVRKMKKFRYIPLLFVSLTFLVSSCVKKTQEVDNDTDSASENFLATGIANDMNNIADEAGRTKSLSSFKSAEANSILSSCATLKFDTLVSANPDSMTVNFGPSNCNCNDGRTRRGSLLFVYTGKYRDSLTTITITPINYFVNDNGVSGSKVVQNKGHNPAGHLVYEITENLVIAKASGGTITHDAKRLREWFSGENTIVWSDDTYYITGTASGLNSNGKEYRSNITKPLLRNMALGCRRHFTSGEFEHTPLGKATRKVDFGDGTCDNLATVTIDGKVYKIELP